MTPLQREIHGIIELEGPMTVERYMRLALGHPTHGYYMSRDPFGAAGDFTTAPEISQMFGELLGLWAAEAWTLLGGPSPFHLVELGPGRGTLMVDALRAASVVPGLSSALRVHLVETSPVLAKAQAQALAKAQVPVSWHADIDGLPDGPAVIIANEFFDALPIRHYVRTPKGWCERLVGLDAQQRLTFGVSELAEPHLSVEAPEGTILEIAAEAHQTAARLARRMIGQRGLTLIIDYGHDETGLGETLQAVKAHRFVDPLEQPGEADLTAHVDFAALARAGRAVGATVWGPVTQGSFLAELGIYERAEGLSKRATAQQRQSVDAALHRLVDDDEGSMGKLFKALAIADPSLPAPAGFATTQRFDKSFFGS